MESLTGAITINRHKDTIIHFTRHAQSKSNSNEYKGIDAPLSNLGITQAKQLYGHYDLILISPLRRCFETLLYSSITYNELIVDPNIREKCFEYSDLLPSERFFIENNENFWKRVDIFHTTLEKHSETPKKILIISHAYFFNSWYMRAVTKAPNNAQIYNLC